MTQPAQAGPGMVSLERFLAEPNGPGEEWYGELLAMNGRVSWRRFSPDQFEQLFVTGLHPEETSPFLKWLGTDYRVPTVLEWRAIDQVVEVSDFAKTFDEIQKSSDVLPPVRALMPTLIAQGRTKPPSLMFFDQGILEWVTLYNRKLGGLGRPRKSFFDALLNPRIHEPIQWIQRERQPAIGFRPVRALRGNA